MTRKTSAHNYYLRDQRDVFYTQILLIVAAARIVVVAAAFFAAVTLMELLLLSSTEIDAATRPSELFAEGIAA